MEAPKLTILIVTWNSAGFLPDLIVSLNSQTCKNYSVTVVDNASSDDTVKIIKAGLPQARIVQNKENLDFARANNQGIALVETPYVLLANHDLILEPDCLAILLDAIEKDPLIGSAGAKLLRWQKNSDHQNIIDSTSLKAFPSRRFIERGENDRDHGQFDQPEEVLGISGALVLLRKSALNDIACQGEILDEDFVSLKEDIDLALRLRWQGWKSAYAPMAIAWHKRGTARQTGPSDWATIVNRKMKSTRSNYASYRNHFLLLVKNESPVNLLLASPFICLYELKKFLYLLLFEQKTVLALFDVLKLLPKMIKKRRIIMKNRKISAAKMRKWFVN